MAYIPPNSNGQSTMANSAPITIASDQTSVKTRLSAPQADVTGNITTAATSITATDLIGVGSATIQISGTYAGVSVIFEASMDNTNWIPIKAQVVGGATAPATTAVLATNSTNQFNVSPLLGQYQFRVRSTAYTSGTAAVIISLSAQFVSYTTEAMQAGTWNVTSTMASTTLTSVVPGVAATSLGKAEDAVHTSGDTGVMALAVRNDNAATSVTSANADYSQISVDTNGTQFTRHSPSPTAIKSSVAASATSVTILASNAARRSAVIVNDSSIDCYISYGGTASTTSYTFILPSLGTSTIVGSEYSGSVVGVWASATGNARVTETTI